MLGNFQKKLLPSAFNCIKNRLKFFFSVDPSLFQEVTGTTPSPFSEYISKGSIMERERTSDGGTPRVWNDMKRNRIEDLSLEDLLEKKLTGTLGGVDSELESDCALFHEVISIVERILIKMALKKTNKVQVAAAQFLGINRNTLRKKIKDLKIKIP